MAFKLFSQSSSAVRKDSEVFAKPSDALMSVQSQQDFYSISYRFLVKTSLFFGTIVIILILICCGIVVFSAPHDRFFTASVHGRVERVVPLNIATAPTVEMAQKVRDKITRALNFGYLDYEQRRAENLPPFTASAFENLQEQALSPFGLRDMLNKMLVFRATPIKSPGVTVVTNDIDQNFTMQWVFDIPVKIEVSSDDPSVTDNNRQAIVVIRALVKRSADIDTPSGYIIWNILGIKIMNQGGAS